MDSDSWVRQSEKNCREQATLQLSPSEASDGRGREAIYVALERRDIRRKFISTSGSTWWGMTYMQVSLYFLPVYRLMAGSTLQITIIAPFGRFLLVSRKVLAITTVGKAWLLEGDGSTSQIMSP